MKKFWKVLGITALAAALVPYRVEKDKITGDTAFEALLWQGKKSTRNGERRVDFNVAPWFSPNRISSPDEFEPDGELADLEDDWDKAETAFTMTPNSPQPPAEPARPEE